MTQTELARELKLERASIGQTIDRLEELELVERRRREERQARLAGSFTPCRNRATSQDASRSWCNVCSLARGDPFWGTGALTRIAG